ncbi:glycosyltransferase family 4 protein [Spirosoma montaniterrae]|uniref:Glycosyltransferase WbuB n=1 Tax=Spirosoma montaniterrae TaxID=1178516 RepID=A0A1P9WZ30_9BACT|nr:glycosyltransferase family 4 protein [Spirosoma montaniterrae]AQG80578.1 glycosyltransferase WbuB [Spirosoma montaniterrae]
MTILYLTFYFEPDLSAGSFRNTALVGELARQLTPADQIHVITTQPNRYQSFSPSATAYEKRGNVTIERISLPTHTNGFRDQIRAFASYYRAVHRLSRLVQYDLVFASSSRLFTAFLGARLSQKRRVPLFLDVRDLFRETILEMLNPVVRLLLWPFLWVSERYAFSRATHINLVSEGFRPYIQPFRQTSYSFFPNGIDDLFLKQPVAETLPATNCGTILYAGNIGAGQGLEKIIPQAARRLGDGYRFIVIGDGGRRAALEAAIRAEGVQNVLVQKPVNRAALVAAYQQAHYLFVHLNDYKALHRVLPSKLFEYGATDKPILAGVAGYPAQFVRSYIPNSLVFRPTDAAGLVELIQNTPYQTQPRPEFIEQFNRQAIMSEMARCLLAFEQQKKSAV